MLLDRYYLTIDELLEKVKSTQKENCIAVGKMIADSVQNGGAVHIYDTGHIINSELIYRGGGLAILKQFKFNLNIENPVRKRDRSGIDTSMEGLADFAIRASSCKPGDVIVIGSVSGKTPNVIDLALAAKKFGMKVVALTSLEYSSSVDSQHSSGKRLFECADITLDNCAPAAEGMMKVDGIEGRLCAASGIAASFIMWSVVTVTVEELLARGITPSVYKSANFEDGPEYNEKLTAYYNETGF